MSRERDSENGRLHALQQKVQEWYEKQPGSKPDVVEAVSAPPLPRARERWTLTDGLELYDWQRNCVDRWFANDYSGTVKVVTGAGKTVLALAIAERLQRDVEPDLHVVVIVPTVVLLNQWYDRLQQHSNLRTTVIGRLGGGHDDDLGNGRRILIAVLNSAATHLPQMVDRAGVGNRLLLIADESHRLGAAKRRTVFATRRRFNLGLSATPERSEDEWGAYDASFLAGELGEIVYTLNYLEAQQQGIIPRFIIRHFGLPLEPDDESEYRKLTRAINQARPTLKRAAPPEARGETGFWTWIRGSAMHDPELADLARRLEWATATRKQLLYSAPARLAMVRWLIDAELRMNADAKIILFHEVIEEAMQLYQALRSSYPVVVEQSKLPGACRDEALALFRSGDAQILVSVKSLIEGFDVPAADVGIIVASSSSVRQRIQSMGRVMRRKAPDASGDQIGATINVLYIRDTTDEAIYRKVNWDEMVGKGVNHYYTWDPSGDVVTKQGPPSRPPPRDDQVSVENARPGDLYPGAYEGRELTCDTHGNVRTLDGNNVDFPAAMAQEILRLKGGGRFKLTPQCGHVLVRMPEGEEWQTRFIGTVEDSAPLPPDPPPVRDRPPAVQQAPPSPATPSAVQSPLAGAEPPQPAVRSRPAARGPQQPFVGRTCGDSYPMSGAKVVKRLRYRLRKGGMIGCMVQYGELFARDSTRAGDPAKGADADRLLVAIKSRIAAGDTVTKLMVTDRGDVVYRCGNEHRFLVTLDAGLEFPDP